MFFQHAREGDFREAVERVTGRNVVAFVSGIDATADMSCEVFYLSRSPRRHRRRVGCRRDPRTDESAAAVGPYGDRPRGTSMLATAKVATRLPAQDLDRARAFYAETLGLEPSEERPGGLLYTPPAAGSSRCSLCRRAVGDAHADGVRGRRHRGVRGPFRGRGVTLEVEGITEVEGNYPSKGGAGSARSGSATARATSWGGQAL